MRRSLEVALSGLLALGLAGCGSSTETSIPPASAPSSAPPPSVTTAPPTAPATSIPRATASAAIVAQARNPATVDDAAPYRPVLDPAAFVEAVDNPYWPLKPGTSYVYKTADQQIKVDVTAERRMVMGVSTVVVKDQAFAGSKLIEDTVDWYAQDRAGNVWYFGEATVSYEDDPAGDHAGSWEAGVDGALPGVVMLGDPRGGDVYRQEFYAGQAEDLALVRYAGGTIKVPAGQYKDLLVTEEWTPLEPDVIELKYYARGIGVVAERQIFGGDEFVQLVKVTPAGP
jgi:hypothetical protein